MDLRRVYPPDRLTAGPDALRELILMGGPSPGEARRRYTLQEREVAGEVVRVWASPAEEHDRHPPWEIGHWRGWRDAEVTGLFPAVEEAYRHAALGPRDLQNAAYWADAIVRLLVLLPKEKSRWYRFDEDELLWVPQDADFSVVASDGYPSAPLDLIRVLFENRVHTYLRLDRQFILGEMETRWPEDDGAAERIAACRSMGEVMQLVEARQRAEAVDGGRAMGRRVEVAG